MSMRPQPARWFEVLLMRDDLGAALEVFARSANVELQSHGDARTPVLTADARELMQEFELLQGRYGHYWPAPGGRDPAERHEPHVLLNVAMDHLRCWLAESRDLVLRVEKLRRRRADLDLLSTLFEQSSDLLPDLERLSRAGPLLKPCLYRLADSQWPGVLPAGVITERLATKTDDFLLAIGVPEEIDNLEQQLRLQKAHRVILPSDLPGSAAEARATINDRLRSVDDEIATLQASLDELGGQHQLAATVADIQFVRWTLNTVPDLQSSENFVWITGWTGETDEQALLALLADADIKGLLRVSQPPPGFEPPLILRNPRWMRPFELFTGLLGVPGAAEADPTRIVAVVGPLMFGYMFGDVGHGAVILVAGIVFSRRYPALRLLIAGGAVSIVFGFLFGSVFALEDVIEPLWLHPMENPLPIFAVPLVGGAVLLLTGMCLDALQAAWQHKGRQWWATSAGLVLCYLALLGSILDSRLLWLALAGAVWFVAGHGFVATSRGLQAAGNAIVELLETAMQLVVNTISFVRVGAFALAHSGLSMAVVGLAAAAGTAPGRLVVLILGNVLIIGLEGLVVSIQTTRLVLFEFFIRFLRAEGRPFRPIAPATNGTREKDRRP